MHNLNLTDETFDVNQSNNYFLLMQSSLNGFSYSICDSVRNKCILIKHFDSKCYDWFEYKNFLQSVIESDQNLRLSFKGISHIIIQKDFTIIPESFLPQDEQELQKFFPGLNHSAVNLANSASKASKSAIICPYPQDLHQLLLNNFNRARLSHVAMPFINNLINESSRTLRHVFHVLIQNDFITIGVAHSASLDFVNSFKTETFEDILYFVVSILEKFNISPLLAEIYIQNDTAYTDLNLRLQTYIGKVRNLKASQNIVYSYIFTEDILERFANMLNLYQCE